MLAFEERGKPEYPEKTGIPGENRNTRGKPEYQGKTGVPGEKLLGAERTNNKFNPHITLGPGIEPGTHWWEASALTTAPLLLPQLYSNMQLYARF